MRALLVIDFINEIVHPKGKLAAKGYAGFINDHDVIKNLNRAIGMFRHNGDNVVFVGLGFSADYSNLPRRSPLLSGAANAGILVEGTWSTELYAPIDYHRNDTDLTKTRVSAFHATQLAAMLRSTGISEVYVTGVATDLAVESTVRSAHDYGFRVNVVADACAAATVDDHKRSLFSMRKFAHMVAVSNL